jgi:hypothetical protein
MASCSEAAASPTDDGARTIVVAFAFSAIKEPCAAIAARISTVK